MTDKIKQLEEKFNKALPQIKQAEPGTIKPRKFNKAHFMKAAQELQEVIAENDKNDPAKT